MVTLLALLTASIHTSRAAERLIPVDFGTIQSAIDASADGDIITITPGIYWENINFLGKAITVRSTDPNNPLIATATVIDGGKQGSVVTFENGEGNGSILSGVTVQNGSSIRYAGGIHCQNSSPGISHCIITHNSSVDSGGGIGCDQTSSPTISNCNLIENSSLSGAGIFCDRSSPTIVDCLISKNLAINSENSRGGGGIFINNSAPSISKCTITNNSASCGGGINCFGPTCFQPKIDNCAISRNLASGQGGGIYYQCDALSIANSTITENSADSGGGIYCTWPITGFATNWTVTNCVIARNSARSGAGINCSGYDSSVPVPEYNFPSPKITNCTIIGNSASSSGGGIFCDLSSPVVTNCIIWENSPFGITGILSERLNPIIRSINPVIRNTNPLAQTGYAGPGTLFGQAPNPSPKITYSNVQGGYRGQGNIDLLPLFTDSELGDYHLQYCSPCVDAGTDPNIPEAETDKESTLRPWDGDHDGMPGFDMGAFEFNGFIPPVIWVSLNIFSGEGLNNLTLLSRKVQIAILGNKEFDVTNIDPATILLGRKDAEEQIAPTRWSYADILPGTKTTSLIAPYYRNGDGYQDLLLTFNTQTFINLLDLRENGQGMICLTITGNLNDGSLIKGRVNASVPMPIRKQTQQTQ